MINKSDNNITRGAAMRKAKICVVQAVSLCSYRYRAYLSATVHRTLDLDKNPNLFFYDSIIEDYKASLPFLEGGGLGGFSRSIGEFSDAYPAILERQVRHCLAHAAGNKADLIIFPEYSIPQALVQKLVDAAREFDLTIVGGLHAVARDGLEAHPYSKSILDRIGDHWEQVGVCPVCLPGEKEPVLIFKQVRSRFEDDLDEMFSDPQRPVIEVPLRGGGGHFHLTVAICSEFVVGPGGEEESDWEISHQISRPMEEADVIAIVAWTPKAEPFQKMALDFLGSRGHGGRATVAMSNTAVYGGSFIATRGDRQGALTHLSPKCEALLYRTVYVGSGAGTQNARPATASVPCHLVIASQTQETLWRLAHAINAGDVPIVGDAGLPRVSNALVTVRAFIEAAIQHGRTDKIDFERYSIIAPENSVLFALNDLFRTLLGYLREIMLDVIPQLDVGTPLMLLYRRMQNLVEIGIDGDSPGAGAFAKGSGGGAPTPPSGNSSAGFDDYVVQNRDEHSYDFCFRVTSLPDEDNGVAYQTRLAGQLMDLLVSSGQIKAIELRYVTPPLDISENKVNIFFLFRFSEELDRVAKVALAREVYAICDDRLLTYKLQPTPLTDNYFKDFGGDDFDDGHVRYIGRRQAADKAGASYALLGRGEASSIVKLLAYLRSHNRVSIVLRKPDASQNPATALVWETAKVRSPEREVLSVVSSNIHDLQDLQDAHHSLAFQPEIFIPGTAAGRQPLFPTTIAFYSSEENVGTSASTIAYELAGPGRYDTFAEDPKICVAEREVYHILRLPFGSSIPGFRRTKDGFSLSPSDLPPADSGIVLGDVDVDKRGTAAFCWRDENRDKHMYVIGQTGTGKSYFLSSLISRDIYAGRGLMVLDPHGDLISTVLARVPPERINDVILFDPNDREAPPSLNMLETDLDDDFARSTIIDEAVAIFVTLYGPEIFGPRIQQYFRGAVLSLMDYRQSQGRQTTLEDVARIFLDEDFRDAVRKFTIDPVARLFWSEFDASDVREKREIIPYFQAKFGPFLSNVRLRNIVSQSRSSLDLRTEMDRRSIVLVDLSKGRIGDVMSRLLGMILVSKLNWAAQSRINLPREHRHGFSLYVDECQNFASPTFSTMLSEARKYGLSLVLSNQYLGQLRLYPDYSRVDPNHLVSAVLGNVGTLVAFRTGHEDAQVMAREMVGDIPALQTLVAKSISGLANYQALLSIVDGGKRLPPVRLFSTSWDRFEDDTVAEAIRCSSREKIMSTRHRQGQEKKSATSSAEDILAVETPPAPPDALMADWEKLFSSEVQEVSSRPRRKSRKSSSRPIAKEPKVESGEQTNPPAEATPKIRKPATPRAKPKERAGLALPRIAWYAPIKDIPEPERLRALGVTANTLLANDGGQLLDDIANTLSLSQAERERIIRSIPTLSQFQITEFFNIFKDETVQWNNKYRNADLNDEILPLLVQAWINWAFVIARIVDSPPDKCLINMIDEIPKFVVRDDALRSLEDMLRKLQGKSEVSPEVLMKLRRKIESLGEKAEPAPT